MRGDEDIAGDGQRAEREFVGILRLGILYGLEPVKVSGDAVTGKAG